MKEVKEKLINYFKNDDLKSSINELEEVIQIMEYNNIETNIIGLIANIVSLNKTIDKLEIIKLIQSNDIENLYDKIYELPYKHIPKINPIFFFKED